MRLPRHLLACNERQPPLLNTFAQLLTRLLRSQPFSRLLHVRWSPRPFPAPCPAPPRRQDDRLPLRPMLERREELDRVPSEPEPPPGVLPRLGRNIGRIAEERVDVDDARLAKRLDGVDELGGCGRRHAPGESGTGKRMLRLGKGCALRGGGCRPGGQDDSSGGEILVHALEGESCVSCTTDLSTSVDGFELTEASD